MQLLNTFIKGVNPLKQTNIYEFLGFECDPIFKEILKLDKGSVCKINHITIKLNEQDLYEIETKHDHQAFTSKKQVYDHLSYMFSLGVK